MTIKSDGRVTPWSDRKLVMPVGSINQPQSYFTVLSGTPRRAPLWKLLPPSSSRYRAEKLNRPRNIVKSETNHEGKKKKKFERKSRKGIEYVARKRHFVGANCAAILV
nr:PREDICTED: uncharacterized protein LOC105677226 isoform X1 [Linepithema humile]